MKTLVFSAGIALIAVSAFAQEKRTLSFTLENDSFFGTDRYYTQGARLEYMHYPNDVPKFVGSTLTNFATFGMQVDRTRMGGALGQELFTPSWIRPTFALLNDRPYAAWMHGSLIFRRSGKFGGVQGLDAQDEIEMDLGVVGPEALGEDTQKWWHHITGDVQPGGWDHQLRTEPALQFYFNRAFRFGVHTENYWGLECIPHLKAAVGTVYDFAEGGMTMRAGFNLPTDFIRSPLESYSTHPSDNPPKWSAYVFTGADGRVVGRNLFLDGSTWRSSQSVDKELFVADFRVGGAVRYEFFELVASLVHRTREFKGQIADENFLSITTQFHF